MYVYYPEEPFENVEIDETVAVSRIQTDDDINDRTNSVHDTAHILMTSANNHRSQYLMFQ